MSEPGDRRSVRVRRSPKVPVFLVLGALAGALVGVVLTFTGVGDPRFSTAQVMGLLVLLCAPIGVVVGGLIAVVLDATSSRRSRLIEAERESLTGDED